ncbi:hypothetical protein P9386_05040 [Caldifermentibacillus hisashii]|uniref:hypothetical protein n=1 Tax=Caldifermentibacillus hisashii TaxID=996558 RepID=UPI002E21B5E5|nr:hypothetical protein [Caldifermentibacillus hisashii]
MAVETFQHLGMSALYHIAAIPPAERLANTRTSSHFGLNVLYEIAALPLTEQFGKTPTSDGLEFGEKAKSVSQSVLKHFTILQPFPNPNDAADGTTVYENSG